MNLAPARFRRGTLLRALQFAKLDRALYSSSRALAIEAGEALLERIIPTMSNVSRLRAGLLTLPFKQL